MGSASIARYAEFVRNVLQILAEEPEGLPAKEVLARLEKRITLNEFERGEYPSTPGQRRFERLVRFSTIPVVKAGWLLKDKGTWLLTDEGREALKKYPTAKALYDEVRKRYKQWAEAHSADDEPEEDEATGEGSSASVTLEEAEEDAWKEIEAYLAKVPPYEFQRLVGGLLVGMGYHVAWIAPQGKDGGVDIVAYRDPLGADRPRIKVQVKRTESKVDVSGLRSFMAVLGDQDIGLFVCVSGFTKDAEWEARQQEKRQITLVGPKELFDLWVRHYSRIPETDRGLLPLKPVWFLAPSD